MYKKVLAVTNVSLCLLVSAHVSSFGVLGKFCLLFTIFFSNHCVHSFHAIANYIRYLSLSHFIIKIFKYHMPVQMAHVAAFFQCKASVLLSTTIATIQDSHWKGWSLWNLLFLSQAYRRDGMTMPRSRDRMKCASSERPLENKDK